MKFKYCLLPSLRSHLICLVSPFVRIHFNMFLFESTVCHNYSLLHSQNMNIFTTPFFEYFDSKFRIILNKMEREFEVNTDAFSVNLHLPIVRWLVTHL